VTFTVLSARSIQHRTENSGVAPHHNKDAQPIW